MKPKKDSNFGTIIAIILLLVVAFVSIKVGMAIDDMATITDADTAKSTNNSVDLNLLIECINARFNDSSITFSLTENVKKSLLIGVFAWLLGFAYWYTSRKNYIHGKTFGTAKWGTIKDISDLFAINIMNKEIKQAKRVKTAIGRFFERRKVLKTCRKTALDVQSVELQRLEEWKLQNLPKGSKVPKKQRRDILRQYEAEKKAIQERAALRFEEAFTEAWKPNQIRKQYDLELADIAYKYQQKLVITTEKEKQDAEQEAKARYQAALKEFYNGKNKIEKIKKKYTNADALFTKTERISIYNYVLNNNTLILGGSGSGKTRGYVMPNVLQAHSSFVITDPKGEILEKAGYFLETVEGYKIRVLNLDDKNKSDGYNPFAYIHPEREGYEERVLSLIEAIIINTDGGEKKGGSDPFWDKAERLFLQAIFFFTCDGFVPEERNMNTVLSLIAMLQIGEDEDNRDSDLDYFADIFKEEHGEEHIGVQQYREFREKASGKTAKSIVISAVARLAPFRTSAVRRIFSYDTMNLERVGEEKTAIFVVVPPTDTTFNFIAGMMFTQLFQELQYCATQVHKHDGQRLPVPVRFILDEFANTCTIPQFVKILAYARSFGVGITPILQSLEQIKNMYKDEWGVIVDNCNTLLYLGSITHGDTLEYMSKLLGKGTFDKRTTGRTRGRSGSSSQNFDEVGRELMDTAEIRKLPKKDCLLVVGGRNPFYSEKYDYQSHPNYKYTSDANKAYSYEYTPPAKDEQKSSDAENRNRRDYEIEKHVEERVSEIMSKVEDNTQEIQMNFNVQSLLSEMGQSFEHFAPIRDELLETADGEASVDSEALLRALGFADEDERVNEILSNVREKVKEINKNVERRMAEGEYNIISQESELAEFAISAAQNLAPIRDELLETADGEASEAYVFDVDDSETYDDDFGDIGGLIANLELELSSITSEA